MVITILNIWNNVWPYLIAILLFVVLIVIHEFGHFIAAKLLGVRVNEFAVGFGPKLFSKQGKETKYSVNLPVVIFSEDHYTNDGISFHHPVVNPIRRYL